jgi:prevent-host-death family protein
VSETGQRLARVGVRELRQNLSVYLDRVKDGETLEVTEHGHSVAHLAPIPPKAATRLEQMVAEGSARPPTRSLADALATLPEIDWPEGAPSASEVLIEMRGEEHP